MPIYEYHCNDCGSEFEKFVRSMFSQETITCPDCGGSHVAKSFSVFGTAGSSGGGRSAADCGPVG